MASGKHRATGKQQPDPLRRFFDELNQPGLERFKQALRSQNAPFTNAQVSDIVKGSASRQIFAPRQRFVGKVTSTAPDARWAADMIVFTSTPSKRGQKFILAVQDIWSRKIYTVALAQNNPAAVATAFRIILGEAGTTPKELNTDMGAEFTSGAFPRLLDDRGIDHRTKDPRDSNAIATLDRAIQSLKVSLMKTGSTDTWADRLAKVTRGQNNAPHEHLLGEAPNSVAGNDQLQFHLLKDAAHDLQHNQVIVQQREKRLTDMGAYRTQEKPRKFERSFQPRYSGAVHTLDRIERGEAVSTDGARHNPKFVLPVPRGSAAVLSERHSRTGSAQVEDKKRRILGEYARKVARHFGEGDAEVWRVGEFLKRTGGFVAASREANLNQKPRVANFLRTCPERFTLNTSAAGGVASVTVT